MKRLLVALAALTVGAGAAITAYAVGDDHASLTAPNAGAAKLPPSPAALRSNVEYVTGDNGTTGGHVAVEGDRLYLGSYGRGVRAYDISNPASPVFLGEYAPGARADAPPDAMVSDGRQIVVLNGTRRGHTRSETTVGRTDITEFIDMTDPRNPRVLWTVGPSQTDGESHNGDLLDRKKLYVPSGGSGAQGLRIYDISPVLRTTPAAPRNLFRGDPAALWESSKFRKGKPVGPAFTHTHDVEIYPGYSVGGAKRDILLLAEGGNYTGNGNTGSIFVIDITEPKRPQVLLRWLHASGEGHHPIRYHHEAQFVDGLKNVMLVTDEDMHNGCGNAGGITAVRLSDDLRSATELSEWFVPAGTPAPVCSVHVFSSKDGRVYVGSYNAGLQIVDYRDPAKPRQAGYFLAEGTTAWGALAHKGYVYVGDMARGLDVFRYTGS